jgi:hypothetical protein
MNKSNFIISPAVVLAVISLILIPGCEFIGDVFKAGVWVGIIIVIAIIAVVVGLIKMFSK